MNHLIFDAMNIACRCFHVYDKKMRLQSSAGVPSGTVYGFLKHMISWREEHNAAHFWVVWEGAQSTASRKAAYPEYKQGRSQDTWEGFSPQLDIVREVLSYLNIHQIWAEGFEADDMIATLARNIEDKETALVVSSDRDLLQLVSDHVIVALPDRKKYYDREAVLDEYGVLPENYLAYKTLSGDKSDALPGLRRVPRKVIASLVREHQGDLESIYNSCWENLTEYQQRTLGDFEEQAHVNYEVMRLRSPDTYEVRPGTYDRVEAMNICDHLELESIKPSLEVFRGPEGFMKKGDFYGNLLYSTSRSTGDGSSVLNE